MPLSFAELISDIPELMSLVNKIVAEAGKLPKPPEPFTAKAFADLIVAIVPDLAKAVDKVRAQAAD